LNASVTESPHALTSMPNAAGNEPLWFPGTLGALIEISAPRAAALVAFYNLTPPGGRSREVRRAAIGAHIGVRARFNP
jgi:hypothetical protein